MICIYSYNSYIYLRSYGWTHSESTKKSWPWRCGNLLEKNYFGGARGHSGPLTVISNLYDMYHSDPTRGKIKHRHCQAFYTLTLPFFCVSPNSYFRDLLFIYSNKEKKVMDDEIPQSDTLTQPWQESWKLFMNHISLPCFFRSSLKRTACRGFS